MITRYGKPSGPLLALKQGFFTGNERFLQQGRAINEVYARQPTRKNCKNCDHPLRGQAFAKQGVAYGICSRCGHLNGMHEDTDAFCATVYTRDCGESYAENYGASGEQAFQKRVADIYVPKAQFLCDSLNECCESADTLRYADFGAGSGYFVSALLAQDVREVTGFEVSEAQVRFGNAMMGQDRLRVHPLEKTVALAESVEADVVSMIGVLEHLQRPREILAALRRNPNVHNLYLSVPTFSPTVFFEMAFPSVMQRQLSAGHTHLYTESSLNWMAKEFGMQQLAAWWFGTDMLDLFRDVAVVLEQQAETRGMVEAWGEMFTPSIDAVQVELDKRHLASEVHMLFQFGH